MPETSNLTYEQLAKSLAERLIVLYMKQLGHKIDRISCQLADKTLTILIEDSLTRPEQLLFNHGQEQLAKRVRLTVNKSLEPNLKLLIEEVLKIPVIDIFSDTGLDTGCTSMVAILAAMPEVVCSSATNSKLEEA